MARDQFCHSRVPRRHSLTVCVGMAPGRSEQSTRGELQKLRTAHSPRRIARSARRRGPRSRSWPSCLRAVVFQSGHDRWSSRLRHVVLRPHDLGHRRHRRVDLLGRVVDVRGDADADAGPVVHDDVVRVEGAGDVARVGHVDGDRAGQPRRVARGDRAEPVLVYQREQACGELQRRSRGPIRCQSIPAVAVRAARRSRRGSRACRSASADGRQAARTRRCRRQTARGCDAQPVKRGRTAASRSGACRETRCRALRTATSDTAGGKVHAQRGDVHRDDAGGLVRGRARPARRRAWRARRSASGPG